MAEIIDKLTNKNSKIAEVLEKFADNIYSTVVFSQIALCLMITLSSAFYRYEAVNFYAPVMRTILTVLLILTWLLCSFWCGFRRQRSFVLFSILYWTIPNCIMFMFANGIGAFNFTMNTANRISRLLASDPLMDLSGKSGFSALFCSIFLLTLIIISFVAGFYFRKYCRNSSWYCSYRKQSIAKQKQQSINSNLQEKRNAL